MESLAIPSPHEDNILFTIGQFNFITACKILTCSILLSRCVLKQIKNVIGLLRFSPNPHLPAFWIMDMHINTKSKTIEINRAINTEVACWHKHAAFQLVWMFLSLFPYAEELGLAKSHIRYIVMQGRWLGPHDIAWHHDIMTWVCHSSTFEASQCAGPVGYPRG